MNSRQKISPATRFSYKSAPVIDRGAPFGLRWQSATATLELPTSVGRSSSGGQTTWAGFFNPAGRAQRGGAPRVWRAEVLGGQMPRNILGTIPSASLCSLRRVEKPGPRCRPAAPHRFRLRVTPLEGELSQDEGRCCGATRFLKGLKRQGMPPPMAII